MKKQLCTPFLFLLLVCQSVCLAQDFRVSEKNLFTWDESLNDWVQTIVETYTYANEGVKETQIDAVIYPGMTPAYRNLKTYNANNDIEENRREIYLDATKTWQPFLLMKHSYTGSNETEVVTQSYDFISMMLENSYRYLTEYDGNIPKRQLEQVWNSTLKGWVNEEEIKATYENGLLTGVEYNVWNMATSLWEPDEIESRSFNSEGQVVMAQNKYYDMGVWKDLDRTTYTYENGLEKSILYQVWNGTDWENSDRISSDYDSNGNKILLIDEEWDVAGNKWNGIYKEENTYQEVRGGLSNINFESFNFKIYPNPTADFVNIQSNFKIDKIELFDIAGRQVLSVDNTNIINIKQQVSGLYLIQAQSENKSFSTHVVIQK